MSIKEIACRLGKLLLKFTSTEELCSWFKYQSPFSLTFLLFPANIVCLSGNWQLKNTQMGCSTTPMQVSKKWFHGFTDKVNFYFSFF